MAKKRSTSITLSPDQEAELARRTLDDNRSKAIETSMERLWAIYKEAHATMKPMFTPEEQGFILDVLKDAQFTDMVSIRAVHLEIEEAIRLQPQRLIEWDLPVESDLASRMQKLTFAQKTALIDAIETHRYNQANGHDAETFL